jgi:hypothetical protein
VLIGDLVQLCYAVARSVQGLSVDSCFHLIFYLDDFGFHPKFSSIRTLNDTIHLQAKAQVKAQVKAQGKVPKESV